MNQKPKNLQVGMESAACMLARLQRRQQSTCAQVHAYACVLAASIWAVTCQHRAQARLSST